MRLLAYAIDPSECRHLYSDGWRLLRTEGSASIYAWDTEVGWPRDPLQRFGNLSEQSGHPNDWRRSSGV